MAAKTKPLNQQKSRKCGLTSGPLRATQSFGLAPKKLVEPVRVQTSTVCSPHHQDAKDSRRSSSPDSPGVLRRGVIHRSSSFDTYYLNGTWPRVGLPRGRSSSDSITDQSLLQTNPRSCQSSNNIIITSSTNQSVLPFVVSSSSNRSSTARPCRHRGQRATSSGTHSRGSLEALNQELETLDLSSSSTDSSRVDGRRVPVIDLLATSTQPVRNDTCDIPSTVSVSVDGDMSSSPPAILDSWFHNRTVRPHCNDGLGLSVLPTAVKRLPPDGCDRLISNTVSEPQTCNDIPSATSAFCSPLHQLSSPTVD